MCFGKKWVVPYEPGAVTSYVGATLAVQNGLSKEALCLGELSFPLNIISSNAIGSHTSRLPPQNGAYSSQKTHTGGRKGRLKIMWVNVYILSTVVYCRSTVHYVLPAPFHRIQSTVIVAILYNTKSVFIVNILMSTYHWHLPKNTQKKNI